MAAGIHSCVYRRSPWEHAWQWRPVTEVRPAVCRNRAARARHEQMHNHGGQPWESRLTCYICIVNRGWGWLLHISCPSKGQGRE